MSENKDILKLKKHQPGIFTLLKQNILIALLHNFVVLGNLFNFTSDRPRKSLKHQPNFKGRRKGRQRKRKKSELHIHRQVKIEKVFKEQQKEDPSNAL